MVTGRELAEIEARAPKATPGPWRLGEHEDWHHIESGDGAWIAGNYDYEEGGICSTPDDAAFIAAAREDVPRLVDEVRRLRALLAHIRYCAGSHTVAVGDVAPCGWGDVYQLAARGLGVEPATRGLWAPLAGERAHG